LNEQTNALVHSDRKRLCASHLTEPGGQDELASPPFPLLLPCKRCESLICPLQNSLGSYVYPASGRHLAVHDQTFPLPAIEVFLGCPVWNDIAVRKKNPGRIRVSVKYGNRLAGLHEEGFIRLKLT